MDPALLANSAIVLAVCGACVTWGATRARLARVVADAAAAQATAAALSERVRALEIAVVEMSRRSA